MNASAGGDRRQESGKRKLCKGKAKFMEKINPGKFFLTWNLLFYFTLYNLIDDYSAIPAMERRERKSREIIKVVIKHCSGYCAFDDAYNEKLTMTPDSISYEYVPINSTETNPVKKWNYRTSDSNFPVAYMKIANMVNDIIQTEIEECCFDVGEIQFTAMYTDKTIAKRTCFLPAGHFEDLFKVMKRFVPSCEPEPLILRIEEQTDE